MTTEADHQARLRNRALRLLTRREHSRAELAQKLAHPPRAGHKPADEEVWRPEPEDIEGLLDQLETSGWLSDARMANAYVRTHARRFGRERLINELKQRGIRPALIDESLQQEELASEIQRAQQVWRSRFHQAPQDGREWARQARFLQARGFATTLIRQLLKAPLAEEEEEQNG